MPSLATLQEYLDAARVTGTAATTAQIEPFALAAEHWVASFCGVALTCAEHVLQVSTRADRYVRLQLLPAWEITSVKDLTIGELLDDDEYTLLNNIRLARRDASTGEFALFDDGPLRYEVTYKGGYTNGNSEDDATLPTAATAAPVVLKAAALSLCHRLYNHPGGVSSVSVAKGHSLQFASIETSDIASLLYSSSMREVC